MGWWGYGVMEGDGPMDVVCGVEQALIGRYAGEDDDSDDAYEADKKIVNEMLKDPSNVSKALEETGALTSNNETDLQAFGYIVMRAGGSIDAFKEQLLVAIDSDDAESWVDPDQRRAALTTFRQQVVAYDGAPISDDTKGLLLTIAEAMDNGQRGLINK